MPAAVTGAERAGNPDFTAVAGLEKAKEALLLLAVDPGLKGALIAGAPGTAKSVLARAFRSLIGEAAPFVELPLGVTEDRLIGGLDFERTFRARRRRLLPGLVARAGGGVLLANEINRLELWQARVIAMVLRSERINVEREGLSAELACRFVLVGTCDPREGPVASCIRDAVGLHVGVEELATTAERAALLERLLGFGEPGGAPSQVRWLREQIHAARGRLGEIPLGAEELQQLARAAAEAGVEGHRVDLFAARAARARAALFGRSRIDETDLATAVELVVAPRANPQPAAASGSRREAPETARDASPWESADVLVDPEESPEPPWALECCREACPDLRVTAGKSGPLLRRPGSRGRYAGAVPHQRRGTGVALEPTLRAAALSAASRGQRTLPLRIGSRDLRFKRLRQRCGVLVIFALDASGSMAANRIGQAKGALLRLLRRAYVHRDRVALVAFRGHEAETVLPPSRSVERAMEAVANLTVGGGTPLAAGLTESLRIVRATSGTGEPVLLVLFTDGRANVSLQAGAETLWTEIAELCAEIRSCGVESVVIGTARGFAGGEAQRLAYELGAKYMPLEPAAGRAEELVAGFTERLRARSRLGVVQA